MDTILPGPACLHQLVASEVRFERHEGGRDAALGSSAPAARGASPVDGFDRPSRASVSHGRRASVRDATFVVTGSGDRFAARQQVVVAMACFLDLSFRVVPISAAALRPLVVTVACFLVLGSVGFDGLLPGPPRVSGRGPVSNFWTLLEP